MKTNLILIILSFLITTSVQAEMATPYYSGYQSMGADSKVFGTIAMAVWYPTEQPSKRERLGPFKVNVAINATPALGTFPLVLISHGSGGSIFGHRDTAQFLAEHGIIAVSLFHPKNNFRDNRDEATTDNWINRPKHVSTVLDTILAHPEFSKHINREKIAVMGHSAGGYTALALIGGIPNTAHARLQCKHNYQKDKKFCDLGKGKEDRNRDIIITDAHDPRFKTGILLAPVGILFSDPGSLDPVTVPVFIYRTEIDRQLEFPFHADLIARSLNNSKWVQYQVLKKANHFAFIAPFPDFIKKEVGEAAYDPPGFNREQAHQKINSEVLVFLNKAFAN